MLSVWNTLCIPLCTCKCKPLVISGRLFLHNNTTIPTLEPWTSLPLPAVFSSRPLHSWLLLKDQVLPPVLPPPRALPQGTLCLYHFIVFHFDDNSLCIHLFASCSFHYLFIKYLESTSCLLSMILRTFKMTE